MSRYFFFCVNINSVPIAFKHSHIHKCGLLCALVTHVVDEVADLLRVGGSRLVLRSRHEVWQHVIAEHLRPVVQAAVENTQIIVLVVSYTKV